MNESEVRNSVAELMRRIYRAGMTTTSGGNLSVRGGKVTIWVLRAGYRGLNSFPPRR